MPRKANCDCCRADRRTRRRRRAPLAGSERPPLPDPTARQHHAHGGLDVMTALPADTPDTRPLRFEAWPDDIRRRAYELWSTIAVGSAPRTEHLLVKEAGEGV